VLGVLGVLKVLGVLGRLWLFFAALTLFIRPASGQTVWEPPNELAVPASNRLTIRFRNAILDALDVWKMTVS
jgi:hypothetical protein